MKRAHYSIRQSALYVAAIMSLAIGCADSSSGPTSANTTTPTPEQSFETIVVEFKRHIEGTPSGFVVEKDGERSRLMATNEVSSEVIPPAKEGDPYRAKIVVLSVSRYSLQRSGDDPDEAKSKEDDRSNKQSDARSADNSALGGNGVDILDPDLIASSGAGNQNKSESPDSGEAFVTRREEEDKRTFDLEYVNGRWTLLTAPHPETERAIELAFQKSLATQL